MEGKNGSTDLRLPPVLPENRDPVMAGKSEAASSILMEVGATLYSLKPLVRPPLEEEEVGATVLPRSSLGESMLLTRRFRLSA